MPQLDQFTYFTQFFWLCLFFFTFYIPIWNNENGVLGISRILKLRNQLLSHRENKIRSKDPNSLGLEDILRKGFSTGVSYMYSLLFEVSQWCQSVDLFGKKITFLPCFGEIIGSRRIERFILYFISKTHRGTGFFPRWKIASRKERRLRYLLKVQRNITRQDL